MRLDADKLYDLLPAVYRTLDHERGGRLKALISVIAEQAMVLEEDLDQRFDDQFIETCAEWVVPYIGDLLGVRELHSVPSVPISNRAEVANTIAYRRRKGTATMLEQLARDVTGFPARAVEFFEWLAVTQHVNHARPGRGGTVDVRAWEPLERLGTAFESVAHTVDARSIARGRGRFNIPNIGIFLWRLEAFPVERASAWPVDDRRFLFHPLGIDSPLFTHPESEETITHLAEPRNVPEPISRRVLADRLEEYYGEGKSLRLWRGETPVPIGEIGVCRLADVPSGSGDWAHATPPPGEVRIDPELGRIVFGTAPTEEVGASSHYGFSHAMGGGHYARERQEVEGPLVTVPADQATAADALAALGGSGTVEIGGDRTYAETLAISLPREGRLVLRAAERQRPVIRLGGELVLEGEQASVTLEGLVLAGGTVRVASGIRELRVRHCTLVPGQSLGRDGLAASPGAPSLVIESEETALFVEHSIVGGIQANEDAEVRITDSIVDAAAGGGTGSRVALGGLAGPGAPLHIERSTILGDVHARLLRLVSDSILMGPVVQTERLQEGCVRFSYVPLDARVPRRHRCQPTDADPRVRPAFTALRYGHPAYAQLTARCDERIREGADDGAEMGALHDVFLPQRLARLRLRLDEYLRFGLSAGSFFET